MSKKREEQPPVQWPVREEGRTGKQDSVSTCERVLGMVWDPEKDMFQLHTKTMVKGSPTHATKRLLLSYVNPIYDPLGIVSPFTVRVKIMLRKF